MPRSTTWDLAAAAGVSLAIVDRVLDRRDGVRHQTIARVEDAVRWIGFVRNAAAANLARNKDYGFVIVLPARSDGFVSMVALAVTEAARAMRHDRLAVSLLRVRMGAPHVLVHTMTALIEDGVDGQSVDGISVMAPETAQMRDAIHHARGQSVAVITSSPIGRARSATASWGSTNAPPGGRRPRASDGSGVGRLLRSSARRIRCNRATASVFGGASTR